MSDTHDTNGSASPNGEYVPSPRPHPRLRPEGAAYAERNRGNMERWFDYGDNVDNYNSARPGERLRTDSARKIAQTNQGVMDEMLGGYPDPTVHNAVHPRAVKGEAADNAASNKGAEMRSLMDGYSNLAVNDDRPAPRVIGSEASEYAERNHGKLENVINNYGVVSPPERPAAKVSYGGQDNLDKNQGKDMGPLLRQDTSQVKSPREGKERKLHMQSQGGSWDELQPAHRMRPEGEGIALKNSNDHMYDIMRSDNGPAPEPMRMRKPAPQLAESATDRSPNMPRTRPGEGLRNYEKAHNQSEMASILRGDTNNKPSTPARNVRHLARSELW